MALKAVLTSLGPMEWLTVGLLVFAGVQVWLQYRAESQRRRERRLDAEEAIDRAFQSAWAEHFRMSGLAQHLERADLVEMAYLGTLQPNDVLPADWTHLTNSLSALGREAGFLGGVAAALCYDVQRAVGTLVMSVKAFARHAPTELSEPEKVRWLRERFGDDLKPWEDNVRKQVSELADVLWDAAKHSPRADLERQLNFADHLDSVFARAAVQDVAKRGPGRLTKKADGGRAG